MHKATKVPVYNLCTYVRYIPGQHVVQETLVVFSPTQSLPPQLGLGWVHVRCWVITPSPQVAEHSVTFCHSLHPPSTKKVMNG